MAEFGKFAPTDGKSCAGQFCCEGGAAGWIDRWILSVHHIYQSPTSSGVYQTGPYDPEGILGTLNSILLCYLGLQAGKIIVHYTDVQKRTKRWLLWSLGCGAIAAGLCGASMNNGVIPINKNLWSASFILLMSSFAFFLFTIFYWIVDVWQLWNGAPFRYVGMNSILIYMVHETYGDYFPLSWQWPDGKNSHGRAMFMNITAVAQLCLLAYYCYRINFFVAI